MKKTVYGAVVLPVVYVMFFVETVFAAPPSYDIDLKELPPAAAVSKPKQHLDPKKLEINLRELRAELARKAKPQKRHKVAKSRPAKVIRESSPVAGASSRYTVKAGDHIALILVRHYGLTENEARHLMPEVMRLNSINNPKSVALGRVLVIPLPLPAAKGERDAEKQLKPASAEARVDSADKASVVAAQNISIVFVSPCSFGRELLEKLGLFADFKGSVNGEIAFAAAYDGIAATVICYPSEAERITYERLSVVRGDQLIVISDNQSGGHVIENIAQQLGLPYRLSGFNGSGHDNPAYIFSLVGSDKLEKEITVNVTYNLTKEKDR